MIHGFVGCCFTSGVEDCGAVFFGKVLKTINVYGSKEHYEKVKKMGCNNYQVIALGTYQC